MAMRITDELREGSVTLATSARTIQRGAAPKMLGTRESDAFMAV